MVDDYTASPAAPAAPEQPKDFGSDPAGTVARWLQEINLYETQFKKWEQRVEKIVKRYRDERADTDTTKKVNVLWSNIATLQPAIYARQPAPDVQRRHKDRDPIGRVASTVLERGLSYTVDAGDLDQVLKQCRDDYLLGGRGQSWVRYEFTAGPDGTVTDEKVCVDYVFWKDFGHTPARNWKEVRAVWKKAYMTRDKLVEFAGKEIGDKVALDQQPAGLNEDQAKKYGHVFKTACVYEIWDKDGKETIWVSKGYPDAPLKRGTPPLDFEGFFPCPRPLYASLTTDSLVPLPDYAQYQDQAIELDELTERISLLVSAIKVAGVYDGRLKEQIGSAMQVASLISGPVKNVLIPVDSWAAFAEKGGLKGAIDWLPIEQIVAALQQLYLARDAVKQELLEVTGLSDIVRGQGDPDETATAQEIKGRFASMRLDERQKDMARFARDNIRLAAEVIAEQFSSATLKAMTGVEMPDTKAEALMMGHNGGPPLDDGAAMPMQQPVPMPPQAAPPPTGQAGPLPGGVVPAAPAREPPSWESVVALLRDDLRRGFRIDIETDSTIALDEEADKKHGIELLNVAAPFFEKLAMAAAQMPAMVPLMAETFMQVIRRFKLGRNIEQTFEETIAQLREMAKQPRADPAEQEAKALQAKVAAEVQLMQAKAAADSQIKQQTAAADLQMRQTELAAETQTKQAQVAADMQIKQAQAAHEAELKDRELRHEMRMKELELHHEIDLEGAKADLERDRMAQDGDLKRRQMYEEGHIKREQMALDYDLKASGQEADIELAERKTDSDIALKSETAAAKAEGNAVKAEGQGAGERAGKRIAKGPIGRMAEMQSQMTQAIAAMTKAIEQLGGRKMTKVNLERGKDGRAVGATVTTVGNA